MKESISSIDENLYLKAKECCRKIPPEARGELYYLLLDWCDKRQDILQSLAQKNDKYELAYALNGEFHHEIFSTRSGNNPYAAARYKYLKLLTAGVDCIELRQLPNPYLSGEDRYGRLILSYDSGSE